MENLSRSSSYNSELSGNLNASYRINDKSQAGVGLNLYAVEAHDHSLTSTLTTRPGGEAAEGTSKVDSNTPVKRPEIGVTGYYTLAAGPDGSELDVTADYGSSLSEVHTRYDFDNARSAQKTRVDHEVSRLKPSYRFALSKSHTLAAGYEYTHVRIDDKLEYAPQSNDFRYKESTNAGFVSWEAQWSGYVSTSAGLRVENMRISGDLAKGHDGFRSDDTDLFPSVGVNFSFPKGGQSVSIAFQRTLSRPF